MSIKLKYLLVGICFGLMFPLGAIIFEMIVTGERNIITLHLENPILFMIDSAPIFLGLFALLGGVKQEQAILAGKRQTKLSEDLRETMSELKNKEQALSDEKEHIESMNVTLKSSSEYLESVFTTVMKDSELLEGEMDTISHATKHVLSTSNEISSRTVHSLEKVTEGHQISEEISHLMTEILNEVEEIARNIQAEKDQMNDFSEAVSKVLSLKDMIQSISEEVDLLALNASIEASRAGEHGRGFAVVATEVKKLSIESSHSTDEMTKQLTYLQDKEHLLVSSMHDVENHIGDINKSIDELSYKMKRIEELLRVEREASDEISHLTESQTKDTSKLNASIGNVLKSITNLRKSIEKDSR